MVAFKSVLKVDDVQKVCKQIKELNLKIKNFKISLKLRRFISSLLKIQKPKPVLSNVSKELPRMWKYFSHYCTLRYVDILPKLLHGNNHAYHHNIKRAPVSVTLKTEPQVSENLNGKSKSKTVKSKFKVCDFVRINKTKRTFGKGYLPNWTHE